MKNQKIWILNQDEKIQAVLQNRGSACPFYDAIHKEQINGSNTFEFDVPANHSSAEFVVEENTALFKDKDDIYQEFIIRETEDEHSTGLYKTVYCEHVSTELIDNLVRDIRPENKDTGYILNQILTVSGSRWQVGNITAISSITTNYYYQNALLCIQDLATQVGGELQFRTEFVGNKIVGRYVDILASRGEYRGKRYVHGKDVSGIKRTVDSRNVVTALVGRGKGVENEEGTGYGRKLDFKDVVWTTPTNPTNKPAGQDWVGDESARLQWGKYDGVGDRKHKIRHVDFDDETDAATLLQKTWDSLQERNKPIITYELEVIDLEQAEGYEHEFVRLGDTVVVIDRKFTPELRLTARVVLIERNLLRPEETKITLGNVINNFRDAERQYDNDKKINDKTVSTSWLDGIIDALQNEVKGGAGTVNVTNDGLLVLDKPADQNPTKAILLNAGVLAIANSKIGNEWDWRTFMTGDMVYADLIAAGTMLADRIRGGELYLGGIVNGIGKDGKFYLLDSENEITMQMDASGVSFDELFVGTISGNNVVTKNVNNLTYYVDPGFGSDNNDGLTFETAFNTLSQVHRIIPEQNHANIDVIITGGSTINEVVELKGKSGSGIITYYFNASTLNGYFRVASSIQRIYLKDGTISHTGEQHPEDSIPYACVRGLVSNWIVLDNMTLLANNNANYCVAAEGANIIIQNSQTFGASQSAIFSTTDGAITVNNVSGSSPNGMTAAYTGRIAGTGVRPNGTSNVQTTVGGGTITGTWSGTSSGTAPSTPSAPTVGRWSATSGNSWDTVYGWRSGVVRQGNPGSWSANETYRGLWLFNYSDIQSKLSGKTIQAISIEITRESKGGYKASEPVYFWTHNNTSASGGQPALSNSAGTLGSFKQGETKTVILPVSFGNALRDGTAKGISIYTTNSSQQYYMSFAPKATLIIKYT